MLTKTQLRAWTKELRAHPEQQIRGQLVNSDETGFCCLGKLCQTLGLKTEPVQNSRDETTKGYLGNVCHLPRQICDLADLTVQGSLRVPKHTHPAQFANVAIQYGGVIHRSLADANDSGVPWSVIADWLDANYPAVEG